MQRAAHPRVCKRSRVLSAGAVALLPASVDDSDTKIVYSVDEANDEELSFSIGDEFHKCFESVWYVDTVEEKVDMDDGDEEQLWRTCNL